MQFLATKLVAPRPARALISRPRLCDMLEPLGAAHARQRPRRVGQDLPAERMDRLGRLPRPGGVAGPGGGRGRPSAVLDRCVRRAPRRQAGPRGPSSPANVRARRLRHRAAERARCAPGSRRARLRRPPRGRLARDRGRSRPIGRARAATAAPGRLDARRSAVAPGAAAPGGSPGRGARRRSRAHDGRGSRAVRGRRRRPERSRAGSAARTHRRMGDGGEARVALARGQPGSGRVRRALRRQRPGRERLPGERGAFPPAARDARVPAAHVSGGPGQRSAGRRADRGERRPGDVGRARGPPRSRHPAGHARRVVLVPAAAARGASPRVSAPGPGLADAAPTGRALVR